MNKMWWIGAFIVIGVLAGAGVLLLVTQPPRGEPVLLKPAPTAAPITVYVSGKVMQPGLYSLPFGSRVNDAIQAAGGFSEQANSWATNLAKVLEDGEQVNIPAIIPDTGIGNAPRSITGPDVLIDINVATLDELDALPEIGPITAQRIINYRDANGPFNAIEDLLEVEGIGDVTFSKIKDLITVGMPP